MQPVPPGEFELPLSLVIRHMHMPSVDDNFGVNFDQKASVGNDNISINSPQCEDRAKDLDITANGQTIKGVDNQLSELISLTPGTSSIVQDQIFKGSPLIGFTIENGGCTGYLLKFASLEEEEKFNEDKIISTTINSAYQQGIKAFAPGNHFDYNESSFVNDKPVISLDCKLYKDKKGDKYVKILSDIVPFKLSIEVNGDFYPISFNIYNVIFQGKLQKIEVSENPTNSKNNEHFTYEKEVYKVEGFIVAVAVVQEVADVIIFALDSQEELSSAVRAGLQGLLPDGTEKASLATLADLKAYPDSETCTLISLAIYFEAIESVFTGVKR